MAFIRLDRPLKPIITTKYVRNSAITKPTNVIAPKQHTMSIDTKRMLRTNSKTNSTTTPSTIARRWVPAEAEDSSLWINSTKYRTDCISWTIRTEQTNLNLVNKYLMRSILSNKGSNYKFDLQFYAILTIHSSYIYHLHADCEESLYYRLQSRHRAATCKTNQQKTSTNGNTHLFQRRSIIAGKDLESFYTEPSAQVLSTRPDQSKQPKRCKPIHKE